MIDYEALEKLVNSVKGTTFAGLTTRTQVKLKGGKKNEMQGRVEKLTENSNIIVFANSEKSGYGAMVKRRMIKEGKDPAEFVMKARPWGTRIGQTPFIEHNGKKYFECIFVSGGKSTYFLDGEPIAQEDIEGLEPSKPVEKPTVVEEKAFSNNDLEDKVIIRTFALESIVNVKLKNEELNG